MSDTSDPSSLVTKTRSPQTHGVEPAIPGILSFHKMFLPSPHSVGTFVSLEMPSFVGPRHCGQLSARAAVTNAKAQVRHTMRRITADSSDLSRISEPFRHIAFRMELRST
jgi:hypothetical protein